MKILATLSAFFLISSISFATHILGIDLEYSHLGNDDYVIELSVRSDCNPGTVLIADSVELSSITSSGSSIYGNVWLYEDTVIQFSTYNTGDTCNYTYNQCLKVTKYVDTITIPSSLNGLYLTYSLCCRSINILNLVDPASNDMSIFTYIPPANQTANSSAQWNTLGGAYLTVDAYEELDFSASDADGDSLVYSLYQPIDDPYYGFDNQATPPENLEHQTVTYENGFSETRPFNNIQFTSDSMSLDAETGLLSGIPNELGIYNLAVKCEEYRNGVKINEILRDFAIEVVNINSTSFSFEQTCSNNEVAFYNESAVSGDSCVWYFGDGSPDVTAHVDDTVTHTFPSITTTYNVQLISAYGTACADTMEQSVAMDSIYFFVNSVDTSCITDSVHLDYLYSSPAGIDSISWSINQNSNFTTTGDTSVLLNAGVNQVSAELFNNAGCSYSHHEDVVVMESPQVDIQFVLDSSSVIDTLYLDLDTTHASSIEWSSPTNGTFLNSVNDVPVHYVLSNSELQDSLLHLFVTAENNFCQAVTDSITFVFNNNFIISVNKLLGFDVSFTNTVQSQDPITTWYWDLDDGSTANVPNPTHTYTNAGTYTVTLHASNDYEHYISTKDIVLDDAGLGEVDSKSGFLINDLQETINITSEFNGKHSYVITNTLGQVLTTESFDKTVQILKNQWNPGVYRLILLENDQTVTVHSFFVE